MESGRSSSRNIRRQDYAKMNKTGLDTSTNQLPESDTSQSSDDQEVIFGNQEAGKRHGNNVDTAVHIDNDDHPVVYDLTNCDDMGIKEISDYLACEEQKIGDLVKHFETMTFDKDLEIAVGSKDELDQETLTKAMSGILVDIDYMKEQITNLTEKADQFACMEGDITSLKDFVQTLYAKVTMEKEGEEGLEDKIAKLERDNALLLAALNNSTELLENILLESERAKMESEKQQKPSVKTAPISSHDVQVNILSPSQENVNLDILNNQWIKDDWTESEQRDDASPMLNTQLKKQALGHISDNH